MGFNSGFKGLIYTGGSYSQKVPDELHYYCFLYFYYIFLCVLRFETKANVIELCQNLCFIKWQYICFRCQSFYATRLTFLGPCIVIYFYSKTNLLASTHRTCMTYRFCGCLLAAGQLQDLYDIYLMLYVQSQTPDDGLRDRPKHVVCCFVNKINLRYCASGWFYYRNMLHVFVTTTSLLKDVYKCLSFAL